MRGLSTILSMMLIVIIAIALIGLTYTFFSQMFLTTTETAKSSVTATTKNMDKMVQVKGTPSCVAGGTTGGYNISFTIKHGGAYAINYDRKNELTVMIGSNILPGDNVTIGGTVGTNCANCINNTQINPQEMKSFIASGPAATGTNKMYIVSPAGEISESVTC